MSFFELDRNKCKRDGICEKVCVAGIIKTDETRTPYIDEKFKDYCIACGLCAAFCPHEACRVEKLDKSQIKPVDRSFLPSPEQEALFLKSRRSVRIFKKESVEENLLAKILDAARYAPSAKNSQTIRWVITKNKARTEKVAEAVADHFESLSKIAPAPVSLHLKAVVKAYRQGKDVILRNAPQLAVAVFPKEHEWKIEDGAIALTYFELAAYAYGLGTCWAGYFTMAARNYLPLRETLGIKENEYVSGGQMFGYPVYKTTKLPPRKPLDITTI